MFGWHAALCRNHLDVPGVESRMRFWPVRAVVVAALVIPVAATGCGGPTSPPPIHDARACGSSTVPLASALKFFHLKMPSPASSIRFYANETSGLQVSDSLTFRFRTTRIGLGRFLAASHLPRPQTTTSGDGPFTAGAPDCSLDRGFTPTVYGNDGWPRSADIMRSYAVEAPKARHPRVLVTAATL